MQSATAEQDRSMLGLVVNWALMIPLIYFAERGHFWFLGQRDSSSLSVGETVHGAGNVTGAGGVEFLVIGLIIFALIFMCAFSNIHSVLSRFYKDRLFSAIIFLVVASTAWSQFPFVTLKYAGSLACGTFFAFFLTRRFSPSQQLQLLYQLGWIALLLSFALAIFWPCYGQVLDMELGTNVWRGIYDYKNACAIPTVFLLSVAIFLRAHGVLSLFFRTGYILLSVLLVLMTGSRTGWVLLSTLAIYYFAMMAIQKIGHTERARMLFLSVGVALSSLALVSHCITLITQLIGKDISLTGRTNIWKAVIAAGSKHPILGYGYMSFFQNVQDEAPDVALQIGLNVHAAHNGFLDVWLALGVIGLGLLVWSFVRAFKDLFACLSLQRSLYLSWCGCIVFLMIVVNIDEKAMMVPNDLIWILYILVCVGLADGARSIRAGTKYE
jgi:O-antigen ligase